LPVGLRAALVIGVDTYDNPELQQLRAPACDAADLADVLADPAIGGFAVTSVINQAEPQVRRRIGAFLAILDTSDLALVYLSCHGVLDRRGRLYFAATDTMKEHLGSTGVQSAWVLDQLDECRARRQILILDCCFSGAFARGSKGVLDLEQRLAGQGRGRAVLTASRSGEYSFEGKPTEDAVPGSVFTIGLVQGLRTGAADTDGDGLVSLDEAYQFAYNYVQEHGNRQTPQRWLYGSEGSIILSRSPAGITITSSLLPRVLRASLDSEYPHVRIGAMQTLAEWRAGTDPARAVVAGHALQEIADRDDPSVAAIARALLEPGAGRGSAAPARASDSAPGSSLALSPEGDPVQGVPLQEAEMMRDAGEAVQAIPSKAEVGAGPDGLASPATPSVLPENNPVIAHGHGDQHPRHEPDRVLPVTAQWALWGWEHDRGYSLLACSDGILSAQVFEEAINRYEPGLLGPLPHVTLSYIQIEKNPHVVLAISEQAHGESDKYGRPLYRTRYFCVPFAELAEYHVPYQALYDGFREIQLPIGVRSPIRTELVISDHPAPAEDAAMTAAAMLLSGQRVCILGADDIDISERLRFLDSVASFLPYGMRAQLSAATWASRTIQDHMIRLFFAADRPSGTLIIIWGETAHISIRNADAHAYLNWLRAGGQRRADQLAAFTAPVGFSPAEIHVMLRWIGVPSASGPAGPAPAPSTTPGMLAFSPEKAERSSKPLTLQTALRIVMGHQAKSEEARDSGNFVAASSPPSQSGIALGPSAKPARAPSSSGQQDSRRHRPRTASRPSSGPFLILLRRTGRAVIVAWTIVASSFKSVNYDDNDGSSRRWWIPWLLGFFVVASVLGGLTYLYLAYGKPGR
jgi:hypothetical protein